MQTALGSIVRRRGGPDIPDWDVVFESARAKAYAKFEDDDDKDDAKSSSSATSSVLSSLGLVTEPPRATPGSVPQPQRGVWEEAETAFDDADFDVEEDEEESRT